MESAFAEVGTSKAAARFRIAAGEVFASKGYGATTTREIATHLDLSPGALYPHYRTKESLLYAISLEGHAASLDSVLRADDTDEEPAARLASTMSAHTSWHARNHSIARVVQYELRALSHGHFRTIATLRAATAAVFDDIIAAGRERGDFDVDDADATSLAINSLAIDVSRWFSPSKRRDITELGTTYASLALRLVGARNAV